ncbi:MAG TPA: hypothetical protein PLB12_10310 [Candidatus Goldiibacteriota bacterium]|nr:hypothetical protein [Candidatus Goldiibacteriota bacterium]
MSNFPKGSEWRKWDLHLHTPETKLNNQYKVETGDVWQTYIDKMESSDVEVFGITDYFSIENYLKFLKAFNKKYPTSPKVFFPNIEFRIESKNSKDEHIQIHVIFSNIDIVINKINNFLTRLKLVSTDNINLTNKYCTKADLDEISYEKAMVKIDDLLDQLKSDFASNEYILIGVARGYGCLRPESSEDARGSEYAKELDKKCTMFFGALKDVEFYLNKIDGRKQYNLAEKPVLYGCDAHSFDVLDKKLGKWYVYSEADYSQVSWVKANPTFEGLKQIIFEPRERVRIQDKNPQSDYPKPYFSLITTKNSKIFNGQNVGFGNNTIPLNSNLVAIIGGRGSGKSVLLETLGKVFDVKGNLHEPIAIDSSNFAIKYTKSDDTSQECRISEENNLDYLHIRQGFIKEISDPKKPDGLDLEIKRLLNIQDQEIQVDVPKVSKIINELFECVDFLNMKDDEGNLINNKNAYKKAIKTKEGLIKSITTTQTEKLIENYTNNLSSVEKNETLSKKLVALETEMLSFSTEKNELINELNKQLEIKIPDIDFNKQITVIKDQGDSIKKQIEKLKEDNLDIYKDFKKKGIVGDISTLLEQVEIYRKEIEDIKQKIEEVEKQEKIFDTKILEISKLGENAKKIYLEYQKTIDEKWTRLQEGKQDWTEEQKNLVLKLLKDIRILIKEDFVLNYFYEKLEKDCLNLKKFKADANQTQRQKIQEAFGISTAEHLNNLIANNSVVKIDGVNLPLKVLLTSDIFAKDGAKEFLKLLLLDYIKYWKIITKPMYKNKELQQLSVGMKGTFFVCLKLATDPFIKPFVFDQPEDDLDNDFIMNELVPIFKDIKEYRQVIIVTHNANLVINADAEQVIVANNTDETLTYTSGAIEDVDIRKSICKILEGGKTAFLQRERKYCIDRMEE